MKQTFSKETKKMYSGVVQGIKEGNDSQMWVGIFNEGNEAFSQNIHDILEHKLYKKISALPLPSELKLWALLFVKE